MRFGIVLSLALIVCFSNNGYSQINKSEFPNPPDSTKVLTWWHWINGHVSKTGIEKDLECMQKVGLGGAILFNVGFYPDGKVPFYTNSWWDHLEFAIRKMDSLDLKLGVYNSDGWSMSGGPWISVEESMMQLTMSDTVLVGGTTFEGVLPQPEFQKVCYDVATIAYPYSDDDMPFKPSTVASSSQVDDPGFVIDDLTKTRAAFNYKPDAIPYVVFDFEEQKQIQSLTLSNIKAHIFLDSKAYIEYSMDGKNFNRIETELPLNLKSEGMNKSLSMSFPQIEARFVKLYIKFDSEASGTPSKMTQSSILLGDIAFNNTPSLTLWQPKSGASKRIRHDRQLLNIQELSAWDENESVEGAIQEKQIVDLTHKIDSKQKLTWKVPSGKWKVMRIAYTSTLKTNGPASELGTGYECNKMDSLAVKKHFNAYVGRINDLSLKSVGKPIDFMQMESWEAGIQNWTKDFDKKFEKRAGYSIIPWLPVITQGLVVNSKDESNRVLWDYRNVLAELIRENYWEVMYNMARKNGIKVLGEGSGMQHYLYDPIKYMQHADVPMGEFWTNEGKVRADCKNAATVAHLKQQKVVAAESFTGGGADLWKLTPKDLKSLSDEAFCIGVNQLVLHTYVHQPYEAKPGITLSQWGNHFQRHNSWFPMASGWLKYLQRCQYALQQGELVTDVCYFIGEGIPAYLGLRNELSPAMPYGLDYDGIDVNTLNKLRVENGKITLPGVASWHILVIRDYEKLSTELLKTLINLVEEGATIVMGKPNSSPSLFNYANDNSLRKGLIAKVWGNSQTNKGAIALGKGKLYHNGELQSILNEMQVLPDFSYDVMNSAKNGTLNYIHKHMNNQDVYFVSNAADEAFKAKVSFRQSNKTVQILDPYSGDIYPIESISNSNTTSLELNFEQHKSYLVLFDNSKAIPIKQSSPLETLQFTKPWSLNFKNSASEFETTFTELIDWSKATNEDIKYFSGTVQYSNSIKIKSKKNHSYILNIEDVKGIAEVYVNNKLVANLWYPPFQIDVSEFITSGNNVVQINVANTSLNQLIGDERFDEDVRYEDGSVAKFPDWINEPPTIRPSGRQTFVSYKHKYSIEDLQSSGIIGKVKILVRKTEK